MTAGSDLISSINERFFSLLGILSSSAGTILQERLMNNFLFLRKLHIVEKESLSAVLTLSLNSQCWFFSHISAPATTFFFLPVLS